MLRDPHLQLRPTVLDTLVVGLLAAVLLDSVDGLATLFLTGTSWSAAPVSALAAGLLLAVGWGVAVWRDARARHGGIAAPARWLHLALGVSTAAGLLVHLQSTGTSGDGPSPCPGNSIDHDPDHSRASDPATISTGAISAGQRCAAAVPPADEESPGGLFAEEAGLLLEGS
ncbi:hypothetical protein ABT010_04590 [Streptomyces sp. NPDC002668]|uniref:hypothetical protein n=1 Tax=Streptomyces sp. NPDC002668 TaxID=3154422 RepID=UPI003317E698